MDKNIICGNKHRAITATTTCVQVKVRLPTWLRAHICIKNLDSMYVTTWSCTVNSQH